MAFKENFYDTYCNGYAETSIQDGAINAGYAVWIEFVAEYLATLLDEDMLENKLLQVYDNCNFMIDEMEALVDDDKECMSAMLIDLMTSLEILHSVCFAQAVEELVAYNRVIESKSLLAIVKTVYEQVSKDDFWIIDVGFIESLGNRYINYKVENLMKAKD